MKYGYEIWVESNFGKPVEGWMPISKTTVKITNKKPTVLCRCVCGKEKHICVSHLMSKSFGCGCVLKKQSKAVSWLKKNKISGSWTINPETLSNGKVLCRCTCGKEKRVSIYHLIDKKTASCGCKKVGLYLNQRLQSGATILLPSGKTVAEVALESGYAYSTVSQLRKRFGDNAVINLPENSGTTSIEKNIYDCLVSISDDDIEINRKFLDTRIKPDFTLKNSRIVIECDGLYWHSDARKESTIRKHFNRRKTIEGKGYKLLAFYEDEILNKPDIVRSIISNKMGISNRVYARKTKIKEINTKEASLFFQNNHLMGKGKGRCFSLVVGGDIVAAIRVVKKNDGVDISRFATKINTSVIGGFSKLLKHIEKEIKPRFIQTFIDRRYGQGFYLKGLGFTQKTDSPSFSWTDFKSRFHRMNFKGNSGVDFGMCKLWDYGQARWVKVINDSNG